MYTDIQIKVLKAVDEYYYSRRETPPNFSKEEMAVLDELVVEGLVHINMLEYRPTGKGIIALKETNEIRKNKGNCRIGVAVPSEKT